MLMAASVTYIRAPPPPTPEELKFAASVSVHADRRTTSPASEMVRVAGRSDEETMLTKFYASTAERPAPPNITSPVVSTSNPSTNTTTYIDIATDSSNTTTFTTSIKLLLFDLVKIYSTPTFKCIKLLKQGGRTCQRIPDGDKKVCIDSNVAPSRNSCIVYSFGVGHDFSFDKAMGQYGCDVFSFDDDVYHNIYQRNVFPRVVFIQIRLGSKVLVLDVVDKVKNTTFQYLYRPLDNIMFLLKHYDANLDVLKMDVEGDEWQIFLDSIFRTDVLERTRQLSVEVHMTDFLKHDLQPLEARVAILRYSSFFKGLKSRGFELAYYEPNYINPTLATVEGVTFSVLGEQLWVNTRLQPGQPPTKG
ncbi:uncharacterized protein [Panulirus ornatus]|uniref:uncharacterized protein n=1 Tax=Panulirus ornatus TaxID=150431 RepID=UPI003A880D2F